MKNSKVVSFLSPFKVGQAGNLWTLPRIRKIGVEGIRMYGIWTLCHFVFLQVKLLLLETTHSQLNIMYQDAAVPTILPFLSRIR